MKKGKHVLLTLLAFGMIAFLFTSCPQEDNGNGGPTTIMDLTMEADTQIATYITNGDIYPDGGSNQSITVNSDQANNGTQSILVSSDLSDGGYSACEARVKMLEVTGAARDFTTYTVTVSVYVPSGQGTDPDYVQFVLWNTVNWSQLQDSGYGITTYDDWVDYTFDVSDYLGAGGSTAWGHEGLNGDDTREKIIQDVDLLSVKAGITTLDTGGAGQTTVYYVDDFKVVAD